MTRILVGDFETSSGQDLKLAGAARYAEDPTTNVECFGYAVDDEDPTLWAPGMDETELRALAAAPEVLFVAHNAAFEKAIWREIMVKVYGFPPVPNHRWHDTMAVCAMRVIPLDLDHAASALSLPFAKDNEGSKLARSLSRPDKHGNFPRNPELLGKVYDYCRQDVRVERALSRKLGFLPEAEYRVWQLDQTINERGVKLDLPFVRAAQQVVDLGSRPLLQEFAEITGGLRPGQRDKFLAWITMEGFRLPDLTKDTLTRVLGDEEMGEAPDVDFIGPEMPATVRKALSIRQLVNSASIKKLARMQSCVGTDGRARGLLQYHGAGTGRWSGRMLQPQNFPVGSIKLGKEPPPAELVVDAVMTGDPAYVEALLGPPVQVVVGALRHAIISETGRQLLVGDFAGIEARIVLALAGQHDKTALMASGKDVYLDMAEDIFKVPHGTFNKHEHGEQRKIGKNTVLGCGFQMGRHTFKRRYCPDQTDEFAEGVINSYRKVWAPLVPALWQGLEEASLETVLTGLPHESFGVEYRMEGEWLSARLPSGRKLWYFHPEPCRKHMPWSTNEKPDVRLAWRYRAVKLGHWGFMDAYGGIETENVVQALARDLLVSAMFKCEKNGIPVVLTVHDEIVGEPLTRDASPDTLAQIMCDADPWAREMKIPLAAECWTGERYRK